MRAALVLVLLTVIARADATSLPVVVAPFHARCFDFAQLARRVVELQPSLRVLTSRPSSSYLEVLVQADELELTARDLHGVALGRETRPLPNSECAEMLDAVALIVTRSATPLHFVEPHPTPVPKKVHVARAEPRPEPLVEPEPQPEPTPPPQPVVIVVEKSRPVVVEKRVLVERPRAPIPRPKIELDVQGGWTFPLDGAPSAPIGTLDVGLDFGRFGLRLSGGVQGEVHLSGTTAQGTGTIGIRGFPVALQARVDLRVGRGAFRIAIGPALLVWTAHSEGLLHAASATLQEPGALASGSYRLRLGRFDVEAGVNLPISFLRDTLTIEGLGSVGHTPTIAIEPYLGAGIRL